MRKRKHHQGIHDGSRDFYVDIMHEIKKMPHVEQDLAQLGGADPERVLRFLAIIAFARGMRTTKVLKQREDKLRVAAAKLSRIGLEAGNLMLDKHSSASYWATILGYQMADRSKWNNLPPVDAFEYIETCVKWIERNADALYHLRIAERKLKKSGGLNQLFDYVKQSTGRWHTGVVARLLNAAVDALNSSGDFTEESLKKTRLRLKGQVREQQKSLEQVEAILDVANHSRDRDI